MLKRLSLAGAMLLLLCCGLLMEGMVIGESALREQNSNSNVNRPKNVNAGRRRGRRGKPTHKRRGRRGTGNKNSE